MRKRKGERGRERKESGREGRRERGEKRERGEEREGRKKGKERRRGEWGRDSERFEEVSWRLREIRGGELEIARDSE
eukprot:1394114-Amorphochlora_amoeboformis.AAC.1